MNAPTNRRWRPCGTAAAYQRGCRCVKCRDARSVYAKRHRNGIQPSAYTNRIGVVRRINGLQVLGWTATHIAAAAGLTPGAVYALANSDNPMILTSSAAAIHRATRELGGSLGPSANTRGQALKKFGHVSLWAWDDIDNPAAKPEGALRQAKPVPKLTPSLTARFTQHAVPTLGSPHVRWTGPTDKTGRGKLAYGPKDHRTTVSARRIAFVLHRRREPHGPVVPGCGNGWCVAGPCMVDGTVAGQRKAAA